MPIRNKRNHLSFIHLSWRAAFHEAGLAALMLLFMRPETYLFAQTKLGGALPIDADDIAGTVTSSKGTEAGVWVIARTSSLPTNFVKIVVTDDNGRYLIPDLPKGDYQLWVRGYGLVDSESVPAAPGAVKNLTAKLAPSPKEAAQYYPSNYWFSLLQFPSEGEFPGTGPNGNGIASSVKSLALWIDDAKNGCSSCHQLGDKATREISPGLGHFDSSASAWFRRISVGQVGFMMNSYFGRWGGPKRVMSMFADWTDRIAAGEYPKEVPPRPKGLERNLVITEWDWGGPKEYFHDLITTDRRTPTVNANGRIYGVHENSASHLEYLDPVSHTTGQIELPVEEGTPFTAPAKPLQPSPTWGSEQAWTSRTGAFSLVMDSGGRVWITGAGRPPENPAYCKKGSTMPSAAAYPLERSTRQVFVYDPAIQKAKLVNVCFKSDHLTFAEDANDTLWFSGGSNGNIIGWLNTKLYLKTQDPVTSQGWTTFILDNNGNGKRDAFTEVDEAAQPSRDKRIRVATLGLYSVSVNPKDGSIWGAVCAFCGDLNFPGSAVRLVPGADPTHTALTERYELPWMNGKASIQAYGSRGGDIDRRGIYWVGTSSGHFASFDRTKCRGPLSGPNATGQHCPEGWSFYRLPGPVFRGTSTPTDYSYYTWVDQFDTLGMGKDTPIALGNGSDSLLPLNRANGEIVSLRVPYPMGFYAKNMDGRIDDPKAGWKGKGVWATFGAQATHHMEGGKGTSNKVVKFQLRPNPLAK